MLKTKRRRRRSTERPPTKLDIAYTVLGDGRWHTTAELAVRIGHSFAATLYLMRHRDRNDVQSEPDPAHHRQWRYRLEL